MRSQASMGERPIAIGASSELIICVCRALTRFCRSESDKRAPACLLDWDGWRPGALRPAGYLVAVRWGCKNRLLT